MLIYTVLRLLTHKLNALMNAHTLDIDRETDRVQSSNQIHRECPNKTTLPLSRNTVGSVL
jgi:hypothetical protein